ncbi:MAG: hypothetical protein QP758_07455 [Actinotignum timonense]|uniref:Uncharacterized protein n=1 Tax=Actinotignum timonense TaxID=1870995 RepID=A0AAW9HK12_9ACTO|nr:hypothetical protein [Actinotignum timonense]MDK6419495.1 hypothetical protein [Actinotignum timonense]MDK8284312.1 hypothetical protein [Actinotignum timonense]MDK8357399.1 hypothetical protein [Actinotignum timonense]MDY5140826.1 hypothetical protein [Actinotignum timonense]MDY5157662.1 hypothetical protein [Actinotignum timonense]
MGNELLLKLTWAYVCEMIRNMPPQPDLETRIRDENFETFFLSFLHDSLQRWMLVRIHDKTNMLILSRVPGDGDSLI